MKSAPETLTRSLSTECVTDAQRQKPYDSLTMPIAQTATYTFSKTADLLSFMRGEREHHEYGRYGNPTVAALEERVAALEGGEAAAAFSSGMAAVTTAIFALTRAGSHVILFSDCYRRTRQFVSTVLTRFGVDHTLVPAGDLSALQGAIRESTRLVITEAPTNPYLSVIDLPQLTSVCRDRRIKTMVDATFATPINLRALEHQADLVVHSGTKYLSGHNDVLVGVLVGQAGLVSLTRELRDVTGAVCDPHAAYLALRGLKTLAVRVNQQNASAQRIALMLEKHPKVKGVWYPGLASHPDHKTASRLMTGFGGVVTFEVDGDINMTSRFVDALQIPRIAPSLGGVESLVEQPALMSYFELSEEERDAIGIRGSLVRYAVGLEEPGEIIADLEQALAGLGSG